MLILASACLGLSMGCMQSSNNTAKKRDPTTGQIAALETTEGKPSPSSQPALPRTAEAAPQKPSQADPVLGPLIPPPAQKAGKNCIVTVESLLAAQHFRGPGPWTPYRAAVRRNLSPRTRRRFRALSHGDRHLRCTYLITINGKHYTHDRNLSNTAGQKRRSHCRKSAQKMPAHIISVTKRCRDLKGGAYYGFVFKPVDTGQPP